MGTPETMVKTLSLRAVGPKAGSEATTVTVEENATGMELARMLEESFSLTPGTHLVLFQNGCRNAQKIKVEDGATLAAQGLQDGATLTVKLNELECCRDDSSLRQSIKKNGQTSYYYAHAGEKELPVEHRYVYGGEPAKLPDQPSQLAVSHDGIPIDKYSWIDDGYFTKVYIGASEEPDVVAAAQDGKSGEVDVRFEEQSFVLTVHDAAKAKDHILVVTRLEGNIVPSECKYRVSAGKRITLSLKKKSEKPTWTRLSKPLKFH